MKIPILNNPEEFKETLKNPLLNKLGKVPKSSFTKEINKKMKDFYNNTRIK